MYIVDLCVYLNYQLYRSFPIHYRTSRIRAGSRWFRKTSPTPMSLCTTSCSAYIQKISRMDLGKILTITWRTWSTRERGTLLEAKHGGFVAFLTSSYWDSLNVVPVIFAERWAFFRISLTASPRSRSSGTRFVCGPTMEQVGVPNVWRSLVKICSNIPHLCRVGIVLVAISSCDTRNKF